MTIEFDINKMVPRLEPKPKPKARIDPVFADLSELGDRLSISFSETWVEIPIDQVINQPTQDYDDIPY